MKSIEQYIREKFGKSDAPAGVDADDLWAGIEQGLPAPDNNDEPAKAWLWRTLFFVLLLLVVGGFGGWFLLHDTNSGSRENLFTPTADHEDSQVDASLPLANTKENQDNAVAALREPGLTSSGSDASSFSTAQETPTAPAAAPEKASKYAQRPDVTRVDSSSANLSFANNEASGTRKEATGVNQFRSTAQLTSNYYVTDHLPDLPTLPLATASLNFPPLATSPAKPFKSTRTSRFSLGLHGGTNVLFGRYSAANEDQHTALNAAVKPAAGSSFGFDVRYQLSKKFAISTGFEYHRTLNTFEHTIQRDTMIEHPSPLNSGQIDAIYRRRVADNLRTRYFTIPVSLHWNQMYGDLRLDLGAGIGLNFRQFANGTTLNASGEFVPFDAATGPATRPETFLSYHLSPSVAYRLRPGGKLWLEAKANLGYFPFGSNELSGTKRNSVLTGLGAGIRFDL